MSLAELSIEKTPDGHESSTIHGHPKAKSFGVGLAALGIVFGDIGTSPLYTFKTVLDLAGGKAEPAIILGILSLVFWTLMIITTVKYVVVAMSLDNAGEGGILAVMSLVGIKKQRRPVIVAIGLFGAALIYGDGAVTPAISVLSALEGLNMVTPAFEPYILYGAVAILILLFAVQPLGTERIGKAFGPIMSLWFLALAALGLRGIIQHPSVLAAVNPVYGLRYLFSGGATAFLVLGGVFLCVTGAEALYADMGHFGPRPIRISWLSVVFPSLLLNYAGQAAIVLEGAPLDGNIFYRLCPAGMLIPMVGLATLATIIASQAIITGAYSMTRQAMQLGWMPRLAVKQTSSTGYGQIYVGPVNWILMLVTVALALVFRRSDNLASAYGIAVSLTMLMTTLLLFMAMREVWGWGVGLAGTVALGFLVVDVAFFSANLVKVADGGYVPLLIAAAIYGVMWTWHRGTEAVQLEFANSPGSIATLKDSLEKGAIPRVPGTAVFLTRQDHDVPAVLAWHLRRNRSLHAKVIVLTVKNAADPWVSQSERVSMREIIPNFWRATATFGFMERPDIPSIVEDMRRNGCSAEIDDVTYYVGHSSITHREDGKGLPYVVVVLFAALERNSVHVADFLGLPQETTVELGRQVEI